MPQILLCCVLALLLAALGLLLRSLRRRASSTACKACASWSSTAKASCPP